VGRMIGKTAGELLKSLSLELGGKSPTIIFDDADLQRAANAVVFSGFNNQGQTCTSGTRVLVQRRAADEFVAALKVAVSGLRVGDPLDPATHIGPLISAEQLSRVQRYLALGEQEGARRIELSPAQADVEEGYFLLPTIFTGLNPSDPIAREEIFGPVLSLFVFDEDDEALELANDTPYGLASSVWTQDLARTHRFSRDLQAGLVWINSVHALSPGSPYGGYKQSGVGLEMGLEAITQLMRVKSVWTAVDPWKSPWVD
jgi:acyl-CoA reductase-like NAD-dependent aldehyde dehydrogenase